MSKIFSTIRIIESCEMYCTFSARFYQQFRWDTEICGSEVKGNSTRERGEGENLLEDRLDSRFHDR